MEIYSWDIQYISELAEDFPKTVKCLNMTERKTLDIILAAKKRNDDRVTLKKSDYQNVFNKLSEQVELQQAGKSSGVFKKVMSFVWGSSTNRGQVASPEPEMKNGGLISARVTPEKLPKLSEEDMVTLVLFADEINKELIKFCKTFSKDISEAKKQLKEVRKNISDYELDKVIKILEESGSEENLKRALDLSTHISDIDMLYVLTTIHTAKRSNAERKDDIKAIKEIDSEWKKAVDKRLKKIQ